MIRMGFRHEIDPESVLTIAARAPHVRAVVEKWVRRTADTIRDRAARHLEEGKHYVSGALATTMESAPEPSTEDVTWSVTATGVDLVRGPMWQYAAPVEYGGRPHRPPYRPIAAWAALKFGLADRDLYRFARAVQRKIQEEGTPATRFMSKAVEDAEREWESGFGPALLTEIVGTLMEG